MAQPIILVHFCPSTLSGGLRGGLLVAKPVNFGLWPLVLTLPLESGGFRCGLSLTFGPWKLARLHLVGLGGGLLLESSSMLKWAMPWPLGTTPGRFPASFADFHHCDQ